MGHKISPTSFRLNITENWRSRWFKSKKERPAMLQQDHNMRKFIEKKFAKAGILGVEVERYNDQVHIVIKTSRPGMLIGRGGSSIEDLRKGVMKYAKLNTLPRVTIPTEDITATSATAIAQNIAEQLVKRIPFRRVSKFTVDQVMQAGNIKGVKISVGGRLDGAEIARTETFQKGKLPLHTLRADIDFAKETAHTTYGTVGVKVWIYKGNILEGSKEKEDKQPSENLKQLNERRSRTRSQKNPVSNNNLAS